MKRMPVTAATAVDHSHWFLLEAGYTAKTKKDYINAVNEFLSWCDDHGLEADDYYELDDLLSDFMHHVYIERKSKGRHLCANALNGICMLLPRARGQLVVASRILLRWGKAHPSVAYPPLTWELAVTIAVQMIVSGYHRFAVATVLAFDCLMRLNEFMGLRGEDVVDGGAAGEHRLGMEYRKMAIRIRRAKTGQNQSVEVDDPDVAQIVRVALKGKAAGGFLFGGPRESGAYYRVFKACCAELGLSQAYVPHSLRHGGATRLHLRGVPIDDILQRGRWEATKSARRYIQSTKAIAIGTSVPDHLKSMSATLSKDVARSFACAIAGRPKPHSQ